MDYEALAKQYGGTSGTAPPVDYAALAKQFGGTSGAAAKYTPEASPPGMLATLGGSIGKGIGDVALGAQRYLGKGLQAVGADKAGQWLVSDAETGKANMAEQLAPYKAANPMTATVGETAGNVLATLPVGGALAIPVKAAAKAIPALAPIGNAISSAGFTTGVKAAPGAAGLASNMLTRAAGGAVTGGASAGLVDPNSAAMGAGIGAALPPVIAGLGKLGGGAANAWREMRMSGNEAGAQALVKALGAASPAEQAMIVEQLRSAPTLVPGAPPTVGQALRTPKASTLEQIVSDTPGGEGLKSTYLSQNAARLNALEGVAPTVATGVKDAQQDLGAAISNRVIPEEKAISKLVSKQYASVDSAKKETINLPVEDMQAAVDKYMGKGTFSANTDAKTALSTAKALSAPVDGNPASSIVDAHGMPMQAAGEATPRAATWDEVGNLRASINKAMRDATVAGDRQALGALTAQKQAIDSAINRDLSPEAKATWLEANASHAAKMDRFHTGPQASIFRTSPNGEPAVQGGEVAQKFWGARPGATDDVKAFRRLVDDNPAMLGQFRSMVTTEAAGTQTASGNLAGKFPKWVDQNLPGLRETFEPQDVTALQNIAADIRRSAQADSAGASKGSITYRNGVNALSLGLLDSPFLTKAAKLVPVLKYVAEPALDKMRTYGRSTKAEALAGVMSDSGQAANAIEQLIANGGSKQEVNALAKLLGVSAGVIGKSATRVLPVAVSR